MSVSHTEGGAAGEAVSYWHASIRVWEVNSVLDGIGLRFLTSRAYMGAVGKDRHLESDLSILIRSWGADASGSLFAKLEH